MKINEMAASWDRVKLSLGPSFRPQKPPQAANLGPLESMETHGIYGYCSKSVKIDEMAASWDRVKGFFMGIIPSGKAPTGCEPRAHEIHGNHEL